MASLQKNGNAKSEIRTENIGNFFMETYNVTDNYGSTISLQNDGLRMVHSETEGAGPNWVSENNRSEIMVQKETGVRFSFNDEDGDPKGAYTFPTTTGNTGQIMTQTATGDIGWTNQADLVATPKFFYSPSIVLPTHPANLSDGVTYDAGTEIFTVNLHGIYSSQFGLTGDVAGATRTAIKSTTATTLPVLTAPELEYFVTYFDNTVFDPTTITLSDAGVMTYKIIPSATVSEKTYMNIVFKVK